MRLCWYQPGSMSSTLPGSRLGSANSAASAVTAMMAMVCQRGRLSMIGCLLPLLFAAEQAAQQALALGRRCRRGGSIGLSSSSDSLAPRTDSPRVRMSVMVCLMMRTRTPSASSTCSSLSPITLVTRPMMPPPVTTRSPRFTPASISRWAFILACCGRISRK